MKLQKRISAGDLSVSCAEDLAEQAESVINKLVELDRRGPRLQAGTKIRFGWSAFFIRLAGEALSVCEPDFKGDPFRDYVPWIDVTLRVLIEQSRLLAQTRVQGVDSYFDDKIVLQKGALTMKRIYLERKPVTHPNDSGWYIGSADDAHRSEDLESLYSFQLVSKRMELLRVLALPLNYLVVFDGNRIESILNEKNQQIFNGSLNK